MTADGAHEPMRAGFLLLIGHRGPYVARTPVLYGQLIDMAIARERSRLSKSAGQRRPKAPKVAPMAAEPESTPSPVSEVRLVWSPPERAAAQELAEVRANVMRMLRRQGP